MSRRINFGTAFCLLTVFNLSQTNAQTFDWAKAMMGSGQDAGRSITVDASGNVFSTGYFQGTVDFDPGPGTFNLTSAGSNDIYVSKMDATGNFVWAVSFGGTGNDRVYAIATDGLGNVYTSGTFVGTVDFDPGAGTFNLTSDLSSIDVFVSKLDASGNLIWAKAFGGTGDDRSYSMAADATGNLYTTGYFQGTVDFDPGAGSFNITSLGVADIFVTKLNASGNFIWAKNMAGTLFGYGLSLTTDNSGSIYTTGAFQGTVDFDPGTGTFNLAAVGSDDIFISKLDSSGTFVWAKAMGSTSIDYGYSIATDVFGNVYTTGTFQGTVDFDPGSATFNLNAAGSYDIYISKLDASGNFVWAKTAGGTGFDFGTSLTTDIAGNVYTIGSFQGSVDFDPGAGTFILTAIGGSDIFICKLDGAGNFIGANAIGGTSSESGYCIIVDAANNIYSTGEFGNTVDFDPGAGTFNLASAGGTDIFVLKLTQCPNVISNILAQTNVSCNGDSTGSVSISAVGGTSFTYLWTPGGGTAATAAGLGAGTYTCTVTNECGNTSSIAVTITEPAVLAATAVVNNPTGCTTNDGSIDLSVAGGTPGYAYVWSTTATTQDISTLDSGNYSVTVTDTNGCSAVASFTLTEPLPPTVTFSAGLDTVCQSTTTPFTLTGASPAGGVFSGTGMINDTVFDPMTASLGFNVITYTYTDSLGCTGSAVDSILVDVCTDLASQVSGLTSQVSIFPNPNNGAFTVITSTYADMMIYDAQGKLVAAQKVQANVQNQINIESSGMYLITIVAADGSRTTQRVVVTK
ncbi:MAG: SBBP repeat-containing protein [Bacteroidia bacterium]|nr:SBBP repeat-containing protein [Bacteroidia bacterium]